MLPLRVESDIEQTYAQRGPKNVDDFWQHFLKTEERGYAFLGDSPCQLDAYQVALRLHPESHSIDVAGKARGHVIGPVASELRFLLGLDYRYPASSSASIRELHLDGTPAVYSNEAHLYRLAFPRELPQSASFEIEFAYETVPVARKCWVNAQSAWPIPGLGEGDTELCFEGYWLPFANAQFQPVSTEIEIAELPEAMVLFNGEALDDLRRDGVRWHRYRSSGLVFPTVLAGQFDLVTRCRCSGMLSFYHQPGYSDVADQVLATAARILDVLTEWMGIEPLGNLTLVQLRRTSFGPYAPSPFVIFTLDDIEVDVEANDWKSISQMLTHELGHFWFGGMLRSATSEQWLSEGFAQYLNLLYTEHAFGEEAFVAEIRGYLWQLSEVPVADQAPLADISLAHPAQAILVRLKGAVVLHCLRQTLGWERFLAFLRTLVQRYRDRSIDTAIVETVYAEVTTPEEARTFFDIHLRGKAVYAWSKSTHSIRIVD